MTIDLEMQRLWTEHVFWTRDYIIAALNQNYSRMPVLQRLLRNQEDIGALFGRYWGPAVGSRLSLLLKQHIMIAGDVVDAAMKGTPSQRREADTRWKMNAAQIAAFLAGLSPRWTTEMLYQMLTKHLTLTGREAALRLQHAWLEDVSNFDRILEQALEMATAFAAEIKVQFG